MGSTPCWAMQPRKMLDQTLQKPLWHLNPEEIPEAVPTRRAVLLAASASGRRGPMRWWSRQVGRTAVAVTIPRVKKPSLSFIPKNRTTRSPVCSGLVVNAGAPSAALGSGNEPRVGSTPTSMAAFRVTMTWRMSPWTPGPAGGGNGDWGAGEEEEGWERP